MYKEKLDAYIDSMQEEMLKDLSDLIRIDSQRMEEKPGMPYGEGPAKVLAAASKIMERFDLSVTNYDNYVVTGDYGKGEKVLDILAHLDVVPVTDQWQVTQPFEPKIVGDRIYGRGSSDDKGPAIAVLYAIKAIRDLGIPLKNSLRVILGSDEECGSSDLEHYYAIEKEAKYSFTPDADFPLINLEKARLAKHFTKSFEENQYPGIVSLQGGDKVNVVPAAATMVVRGLAAADVEQAAEAVQKEIGVELTVSKKEADDILIAAKGIAAHGSTPEDGSNAITALLLLADRLPLAASQLRDTIHSLTEKFPHGDTRGAAFGIAMEDEISGALSLNLGVLHVNESSLDGEIDIRCPLCGNDDNVTAVLAREFASVGITFEEGKMTPAHYVPADSTIVQTLLESYEKYFGKKGEPLYTGGGTYVHELERGVAFGCMVPEVDNHMHGDDEFMEISMLMRSTKIFADAIIHLCNAD